MYIYTHTQSGYSKIKWNNMTYTERMSVSLPCFDMNAKNVKKWEVLIASLPVLLFHCTGEKLIAFSFSLSSFPASHRLRAIICTFTCFYLLPNLKLNNRTNKAAPAEPNYPQSISLHVRESVLQLKSRLVQLIMVHNWATGQKAFIFVKYKSSQRPAVLQVDMYTQNIRPKHTHRHTHALI